MAKVEFIYDRDCPNIKSTRSNLLLAFSRLKIPANWIEWERNSEESPDYARKYGSPTILVNGQDLANIQPNDSNNCRLYNGSGTPSVDLLVNVLKNQSTSGKRAGILGAFSIGPGVGAAILAKASCPLCYPAIAGFLTSIGAGFLFEGTYFLILMSIFFAFALFGLFHRAKSRRGYYPFFLGFIGVTLASSGKYFESDIIFYFGIGALLVASVWNLIPAKSTCSACVIEAQNRE